MPHALHLPAIILALALAPHAALSEEALGRVFPPDFKAGVKPLSPLRAGVRSPSGLVDEVRKVFHNIPVGGRALRLLADCGLYDTASRSLTPLASTFSIRVHLVEGRVRAIARPDAADFLMDYTLYRHLVRDRGHPVLANLREAWPYLDPDDQDALWIEQGIYQGQETLARRAALDGEARVAFDAAFRDLARSVEGSFDEAMADPALTPWGREVLRQASLAAGSMDARVAASVRAHAAAEATLALATGPRDAEALAKAIGKPGLGPFLDATLADVALVDPSLVQGGGAWRVDPSRRREVPTWDEVREAQENGRLAPEHLVFIDPMLAVASRAFVGGKGTLDGTDQANRYAFFDAHPEPMESGRMRDLYFDEKVDVHARSLRAYLADRGADLDRAIQADGAAHGLSDRDQDLAAALVADGHKGTASAMAWFESRIRAIEADEGAPRARADLRASKALRTFFDRTITNNIYRETLTLQGEDGGRYTIYAVRAVLTALREHDPPYPETVPLVDLVAAVERVFRAAGIPVPAAAFRVPDLAALTPEAWKRMKDENAAVKLIDLVGFRLKDAGQPPVSVGQGYPLTAVLTPAFDLAASPADQTVFSVDISPLIALPRDRPSTFVLALPGAPARWSPGSDLADLPERTWDDLLSRWSGERDPFGPTSFVSTPVDPGTVAKALVVVRGLDADALAALLVQAWRAVLSRTTPLSALPPIVERRMAGIPRPEEAKRVLEGALARLQRAIERAERPEDVLSDLPAYGIDTVAWVAILGRMEAAGEDLRLRTADFQKKGNFSESVLNEALNPLVEDYRIAYPMFKFEYQGIGRSSSAAWRDVLPTRVYYDRQLYGKPQVDLVIEVGDRIVLVDPKTGGSPFSEEKWGRWFDLIQHDPEVWLAKNPRFRGRTVVRLPVLIHTREDYPTAGLKKTRVIPFRALCERTRAAFGDQERPTPEAWQAFIREVLGM